MISTVRAALPRTQHGLHRPYHQNQSSSITAMPRTLFCVVDSAFCWAIWCVKMWMMVLWTQDKMAAVWETHINMLWVQLKCVKWSEKTWNISTVTPCERWDFVISSECDLLLIVEALGLFMGDENKKRMTTSAVCQILVSCLRRKHVRVLGMFDESLDCDQTDVFNSVWNSYVCLVWLNGPQGLR